MCLTWKFLLWTWLSPGPVNVGHARAAVAPGFVAPEAATAQKASTTIVTTMIDRPLLSTMISLQATGSVGKRESREPRGAVGSS